MPTVGFAMDTVRSVKEGDGAYAYRLLLSEASTQTVTVTVRTFDLQDGSDFVGGLQTIMFQPGQTIAEGRLKIVDDDLYEARETVSLVIDFAHNAQISSSSSISLGILDNEPAIDRTVAFGPPTSAFNSIRVGENAGFYERDVILSRPATEVVTVIVGSLSGVAANGYDPTTRTLVFQPGETVKPFHFTVRDDQIDEANEQFFFTIRGATNAALDPIDGKTQLNGYVVDDDAPTGPTVRFAAAPTNLPVVDETAGTVRIVVELTAPSMQTVTASVETYANSSGATHTSNSIITFRPGETSVSFDVVVPDDMIVDRNASIFSRFGYINGAAPDYSSGAASPLSMRIRDDEGVTVTRGTDGDDSLVAVQGANDLFGSGGNDRIISRFHDNHIFGGDGIDTAIYLQPAKAYDIIVDGKGSGYMHARDLLGIGGYSSQKHDSLDSIERIERIELSDGKLTFDMQAAAAQVYRLYDSVLGRAPDHYGAQYWTHALEGGRSLVDVAAGFVGSAEFGQLTASFSHADLVEYIYQTALGRPSDAEGKAYWVRFLDGGHSVAELMVGFSESPEHIEQTRSIVDDGLWTARQSYQDVEFLYLGILGRVPDAQGLSHWTNVIESGMTKRDLAAMFTQSEEYRATIAGKSNGFIVDHFYETALHRAADLAGKAAWTAYLDQGGSVADLALGFQASEEFHALALQHVEKGVSFSGGFF